jgi:hypothetical protein
MMHFSSALALFTAERLQTAVSFEHGSGLPRAMNDLEATLDSMAEKLTVGMGPNSAETMNSAARIASQVVQQSFAQLSLLDPRRAASVAMNMLGTSKRAEDEDTTAPGDGQPQLAVEVLSAAGH